MQNMKTTIHKNLNIVMQKELNMIKELLVDLSKYIEIENSNEEYAINKIAENILIGVFNILFDCDLKNMGYIKKNYPAIDLQK